MRASIMPSINVKSGYADASPVRVSIVDKFTRGVKTDFAVSLEVLLRELLF